MCIRDRQGAAPGDELVMQQFAPQGLQLLEVVRVHQLQHGTAPQRFGALAHHFAKAAVGFQDLAAGVEEHHSQRGMVQDLSLIHI